MHSPRYRGVYIRKYCISGGPQLKPIAIYIPYAHCVMLGFAAAFYIYIFYRARETELSICLYLFY